MTPSPLVSVVIPTFNRLDYLRLAIESVHSQTMHRWELIIVDDGSDDETRFYLDRLRDSRTTIAFHNHTGMPAVIRNVGISLARGRYIAFLDSDDIWMPTKLQRQVELMTSAPERRWSYTDVQLIDSDNNVTKKSVFTRKGGHEGSIVAELLSYKARIATPTVIAEASLVRELGGFDRDLKYAEDYDLWLRMAMTSEVSVEPAPLCAVRRHGNHFSDNQTESTAGLVALYRKMERLMPTRRLRDYSRRRWGHHLLRLAAHQAREGNWRAMRSTIGDAVRGRVFELRGWLVVARAIALGR